MPGAVLARSSTSTEGSAIIAEIEREGAEVDRECRDYILHEEYGSSKRKFQNGWMRDCRADRLHA